MRLRKALVILLAALAAAGQDADTWANIPREADSCLASQVERWHTDGHSFHIAKYGVLAAQSRWTNLRFALPKSWALIKVWKNLSPFRNRSPMPRMLADAFTAVALAWARREPKLVGLLTIAAVLVQVGLAALLRAGGNHSSTRKGPDDQRFFGNRGQSALAERNLR